MTKTELEEAVKLLTEHGYFVRSPGQTVRCSACNHNNIPITLPSREAIIKGKTK